MKGAPVTLSGTGVVALAGVAVVGVLALVLINKGPQAVKDWLNKISPLNHDNAIATGVNEYGATIYTAPDDPGKNADGSWSAGGWVYDVLNPDTAQAVRDISKPVNTGGVTGSW